MTKLAVAAHETDSIKIPDTGEGIFKVIHEKHAALTKDVQNKNLKAVHAHAENLQTIAKALPAKASKENTSRAEGGVNNVIKVTDELHHAADAGELVKTEANLKKLDGLPKVLQTQFGMKMEAAGEHKP